MKTPDQRPPETASTAAERFLRAQHRAVSENRTPPPTPEDDAVRKQLKRALTAMTRRLPEIPRLTETTFNRLRLGVAQFETAEQIGADRAARRLRTWLLRHSGHAFGTELFKTIFNTLAARADTPKKRADLLGIIKKHDADMQTRDAIIKGLAPFALEPDVRRAFDDIPENDWLLRSYWYENLARFIPHRREARAFLIERLTKKQTYWVEAVTLGKVLTAVADHPEVRAALLDVFRRKDNPPPLDESIVAGLAPFADEPAIQDAFLQCLTDPTASTRRREVVCTALRRWTSIAGVRVALMHRVADDRTPPLVRAAAAEALAPHTGDETIRAVFLNRFPTAESVEIERLCQGLVPHLDRPEVRTELLRRACDRKTSTESRCIIWKTLAVAGDLPDIAAELIARLTDPQEESEVRAVVADGLSPNQLAPETIADLLGNPAVPDKVRISLCNACIRMGLTTHPAVTAALLDVAVTTRQKLYVLRESAFLALRTLHDRDDIAEHILAYVARQNLNFTYLPEAVFETLGAFGRRPAVRTWLVDIAADPKLFHPVRESALQALRPVADEPEVKRLVFNLLERYDEPTELRLLAAQYLTVGAPFTDDERQKLLGLLNDPVPEIRDAAFIQLCPELRDTPAHTLLKSGATFHLSPDEWRTCLVALQMLVRPSLSPGDRLLLSLFAERLLDGQTTINVARLQPEAAPNFRRCRFPRLGRWFDPLAHAADANRFPMTPPPVKSADAGGKPPKPPGPNRTQSVS